MFKSKTVFLTLTVFLLLTCGSMFAQGELGVVGKIFTNEEIDQLYGPVLESISIDSQELLTIVDKAENYAMFTIKNNQIIITNEYRELISPYKIFYAGMDRQLGVPNRNVIEDSDPLNLYSKSMVKKVVELGNQSITKVERRAKKVTITNGLCTLEMSTICPPYCLRK
ncbi:MAG: hypothetical protein V1720_16170 [bacterium]